MLVAIKQNKCIISGVRQHCHIATQWYTLRKKISGQGKFADSEKVGLPVKTLFLEVILTMKYLQSEEFLSMLPF